MVSSVKFHVAGDSGAISRQLSVRFLKAEQDYLVLACSASRVASRVLMRDSLGSFWMIGSMAHPNPSGTSRVSDMARHSTTTPASRGWKRQYELRRQRNP